MTTTPHKQREATLTPIRTRGRADHADLVTLVRRVADGDVTAFAAVYDATASRVYGLCRRLVGDALVAEEVTAAAYQQVWRRAADFDPERGSVKAWVVSVAHRVAVEHRRTMADVPRLESFDSLDLEDTERANAALAALSTLEWVAVEQAYFGGRQHAEVAVLLGVSPEAACARVRQGLQRMREF